MLVMKNREKNQRNRIELINQKCIKTLGEKEKVRDNIESGHH